LCDLLNTQPDFGSTARESCSEPERGLSSPQQRTSWQRVTSWHLIKLNRPPGRRLLRTGKSALRPIEILFPPSQKRPASLAATHPGAHFRRLDWLSHLFCC